MIAYAVQRGHTVYVYNDRNHTILTIGGELYGYTSNTVSVLRGNVVWVYNDKGSIISNHFAN